MIRLDAQLAQGASAARGRDAGFHTAAFPYVPGWVVRGSLAAAWIRRYGPPDPGSSHRHDFVTLFEGAIRFGPLLPPGATFEPLSVVRCKYPRTTECSVFHADLAFDDADGTICPGCGGATEPLKGTLRGSDLRQRTRVALDPMGRALDGALFTREEIPARSTLAGVIDGLLAAPPKH